MIGLVDFGRAALQAYQDVEKFLGSGAVGPPPSPLPDPFIHHIRRWNWYVNFAIKFTGVIPYRFSRFPLTGYGSWLFARKKPVIVINYDQLKAWEQNPPGDYAVPGLVQAARAVLHEIGHLRLHKHLLAGAPPGRFARAATRQEEEEAWVYAMCALAILVGRYARQVRPDNSSAIAV